ncbi:MAG: hypothetical protein CMJ78_04460 [Planctomycetaceae bacterium]|nr:hypothetical protein [Planctomycetaceae bacterium]
MLRYRLLAALPLLFVVSSSFAAEITPEELAFFESKIRPVLIRECYGCHSNKAGNVRGGLRLDTKQLMLIGGSSGPAIVPANLEESWLYNAMNHEDFEMPPKRKLPQSVINDFKKWIEMGAPDPRVNTITKVNSKITKTEIAKAKRTFWAYQKPTKSTPPRVKKSSWPKTDIDRFLLAKLEEANLSPADAEPYQVLRRLNFDLLGLPSTVAQIKSFEAAWKRNADKAIADVVDRSLARDQYGERWGRHWLDVVRYAESTGREVNMTYPQAWRYRDYVIDSFNEDKPFDRFVQEQIAGDLLPVKTDEQWAENLVATTFLAIGPKNVNEQNPVQFAADVADEQIDVTTRVFLAMSVACARCHDHKFDPIPQADYYAMAGIFNSMTTYFGNPQSDLGKFKGAQEKQTSTLLILPIDDANPWQESLTKGEIEDLRSQVFQIRQQSRQARMAGGAGGNAQRERAVRLSQLSALSGKIASVDEDGKPLSFAMGVQELGEPVDAKLLVRGEIDQQAQTVPRGFPHVLTSTQPRFKNDSSGRLDLARWIGNKNNPLTARVMVNRIWLHLIGRGIVTSTENFGSTGQMPGHPKLLDYLAVRFMDSDWSIKSVIREIATSRVYRMQSTFGRSHHEQDPDNALVWRANPRRLDAEALRDAMLSISGEIDLERPRASEVARAGFTRILNGRLIQQGTRSGARIGGSSQQGARPQGRFQPGQRRPGAGRPGQGRPGQGGRFRGRPQGNQLDMVQAKFRSVYLPIIREHEPRSLEVFDFADSSVITGQRAANQALYMMNNPLVIQQSEAFAARLAKSSTTSSNRVSEAFMLAYGRPATSGERAAISTFARKFDVDGSYQERQRAILKAICQGLFASAEFRYLD